MGADNLINFHKWQKWRKIFKEISVVVFKRHGYNNNALQSTAYKSFSSYRIDSSIIVKNSFENLPSWTYINNKEIKVSSSDIRKQRALFKGIKN